MERWLGSAPQSHLHGRGNTNAYPRPSASIYGQLPRTNTLPRDLLARYGIGNNGEK